LRYENNENRTCNNLNANDAIIFTWKPEPQTIAMKFRAAFIAAVVLPFCLCVVVLRCCAADTSFVEEKKMFDTRLKL